MSNDHILTNAFLASGGGIAGLASAISICKFSEGRKDIKVDLYESTKSFTEIGAGIALWLRPWRALRELGLADDLTKLLEKPISELPPSMNVYIMLLVQISNADKPSAHIRVQKK